MVYEAVKQGVGVVGPVTLNQHKLNTPAEECMTYDYRIDILVFGFVEMGKIDLFALSEFVHKYHIANRGWCCIPSRCGVDCFRAGQQRVLDAEMLVDSN